MRSETRRLTCKQDYIYYVSAEANATMPLPLRTAIVLIDPYNDFLHPDGKATSALKDLEKNNTVSILKS